MCDSTNETSILDINSSAVHDEVELLLNSEGKDIMELISSDPKYYLDIVSRYTKTREGQEICLPYLFNITIIKSPEEFRIKFKFSDNANWNEVGFSGGDFDEEDVYKAFTKKVNYLIDKPIDFHRSLIDDNLNSDMFTPKSVATQIFPDTGTTPQIVSQGDQTKLTKIDRFLGRTVHESKDTSSKDETSNITYSIKTEDLHKKTSCANCWLYLDKCICNEAVDGIRVPGERDLLNLMPNDQEMEDNEDNEDNEDDEDEQDEDSEYEDSEDEEDDNQDYNSTLVKLDALKILCPNHLSSRYSNLLTILGSKDPFYTTIIDSLPKLSSGKRLLLTDFLIFNN